MKKQKYSGKMKLKVVLELLSNEYTVAELCSKYELHHSMIHRWKNKFLKEGHQIFDNPQVKDEKEKDMLIDRLYKKIGEREVELEWIKKKSGIIS